MKAVVKLLAASVMAVTATTAMAGGSNWYIGVGGGQSTVKDWYSKGDMESILNEEAYLLDVYGVDGDVGSDSEDTDIGYKIFGGYQFGKNLAVEVSYIDLGESTASSDASGYFYSDSGDFNGSIKNKLSGEAEAFTVDALLTLPVADIAKIFFKVGAYRADAEQKFSIAMDIEGDSFSESDSVSDTSTGVHLGLGVDFKLTESIGLRAEWERLDGVEIEEADSKTDIDLLSASLIYNF